MTGEALDGAVKVTDDCALPGEALTDVGALGGERTWSSTTPLVVSSLVLVTKTLPDESAAIPSKSSRLDAVASPAVGSPLVPVPAMIESVPAGVTFSMA